MWNTCIHSMDIRDSPPSQHSGKDANCNWKKRKKKRKTIKSRQTDKHGSLSRQGRNGGTKAGIATRWTKGEQRTGCKQTAAQIKLISVQLMNTVEHKGEGGAGWRQRGGASKEKRLDRRNLITVLWLIFFCLFCFLRGALEAALCLCGSFIFRKWTEVKSEVEFYNMNRIKFLSKVSQRKHGFHLRICTQKNLGSRWDLTEL